MNLPKGFTAICCRWVFRENDNKQYKVRLVVKEYSQIEGIDYNEIFSLIVKHIFIRLLLMAIVTQGDIELEQLDVKHFFIVS